MKKTIALAISMVLSIATVHAAVIFQDNFNSYSNGVPIGGPNWNAKWDANTNNVPLQQNLFTAVDEGGTNGIAKLDTQSAHRNYFIVSQTAATIPSNHYATVVSDFRIELSAGDPPSFNQNAFGLLVSTKPAWWDGVNGSFSLCHRGGAWGNRLPVDPWLEGWNAWSELGLDKNVGGTSDWFRIEWTIENGASNYVATAKVLNMAGDTLHAASTIELNIANETPIYAGYTTDWNDLGPTNVASFSNVQEVDMDNFKVEVTKVPVTEIVFEDDFESASYLTYPKISDWQNPDPWNKALNNPNSHIVTNGVLKPFLAWRGVANDTYPVVATTGEIVRVEFDFQIDLGSSFATATLGDYMLVQEGGPFFTNWVSPALYFDSSHASSGLARRVEFNAWTDGGNFPDGRMTIALNGGATDYILASDVGLAPATGSDYISDPLHMTFQYTKKSTYSLWECVTMVSNMTENTSIMSTQTLVNATAWDAPELFYAMQNEAISGASWEIDNFILTVSSGEEIILQGFDAWAESFGLLGGPDDDDDGDDMSNLWEYGLNGDPTNSANVGTLPEMTIHADGTVSYTHPYINDAGAGILYEALWRDNLAFGVWQSAWLVDSNAPTANPDYDQRMLEIDGSAKDHVFIKFNISQP